MRTAFALGIILAFATTAGVAQDKKRDNKLPDEVLAVLEKATEFEVYSLAGTAGKDEKDVWRRAKVLGKITVKKDEDRKALLDAVKKGVSDGGNPARCFIPRHGIRATHETKTVDLVICFECSWVHVYSGAEDRTALGTGPAAMKALNDILTAAKVPLDKEK